uniref:Uncharacterized protein n=1 Tax=Siphoviridae sp. ctxjx4 TaxID=2826522 RepID=A0A8S5M2G1_9CAUD|nr:MAG TPA: hypothetical protein [Siphoviridae sp. ctxjx4]
MLLFSFLYIYYTKKENELQIFRLSRIKNFICLLTNRT